MSKEIIILTFICSIFVTLLQKGTCVTYAVYLATCAQKIGSRLSFAKSFTYYKFIVKEKCIVK